MNLECRKTPCSIHLLVTLSARLSHYEGQRKEEKRENSKAVRQREGVGEEIMEVRKDKERQKDKANKVRWKARVRIWLCLLPSSPGSTAYSLSSTLLKHVLC